MQGSAQIGGSLRGASSGQAQCGAAVMPMDRGSFVSAGQRLGATQERLRIVANRLCAVTERIVGAYPGDPSNPEVADKPNNVVSALHTEIDVAERQIASMASAVSALEQATGA